MWASTAGRGLWRREVSFLGSNTLYCKWVMIEREENKRRPGRNFCQKSHGRFETRIEVCPFPAQSSKPLMPDKFTSLQISTFPLCCLKMQNFSAVTSCNRRTAAVIKCCSAPWLIPHPVDIFICLHCSGTWLYTQLSKAFHLIIFIFQVWSSYFHVQIHLSGLIFELLLVPFLHKR